MQLVIGLLTGIKDGQDALPADHYIPARLLDTQQRKLAEHTRYHPNHFLPRWSGQVDRIETGTTL